MVLDNDTMGLGVECLRKAWNQAYYMNCDLWDDKFHVRVLGFIPLFFSKPEIVIVENMGNVKIYWAQVGAFIWIAATWAEKPEIDDFTGNVLRLWRHSYATSDDQYLSARNVTYRRL